MLFVGLETTFKSLTSPIFSGQVRWHVSIRIASVLALVIVTWIPALVFPVSGPCLESLIWWTAPFAKAGVGMILVLIFTFVTSASIITFQLLTTTKVDRDRRIEASRIVLYLLFSSLVLVSTTGPFVDSTHSHADTCHTFLSRVNNAPTRHHLVENCYGGIKFDWIDSRHLSPILSVQS